MLRPQTLVASLILGASSHLALADAPIAVRVLPSSTFTDNPCNAPCQCIVDPIPRPIRGRMLFAISPSIPEVSALRGAFRLVDPQFPDLKLEGEAFHITHFDPAFLSRLSLDTSYGGAAWLIDSGFFTPSAEFPNVSVNLSSAQSDCTSLHLHLDLAEVCLADFDNGSGDGIPDDAVTIDDLLFYLAQFEHGGAIADIESTFNDGIPDQAVTIDDLLAFLIHFESGC